LEESVVKKEKSKRRERLKNQGEDLRKEKTKFLKRVLLPVKT